MKTRFGDYVQVFRLRGASFECADDETLNTWHERLNVLWRNIASPQVALWTHVIRRREVTPSRGGDAQIRRRTRAASTAARLADQTLMVNELYLSTVYRPTAGVASGLASKILKRHANDGLALRTRRCARCLREAARDGAGLARAL